ncbi:MAG: hypothetical protein RLZZ516_228 [Cyanobacteriota bacterium]|jgi:hypothetical protein
MTAPAQLALLRYHTYPSAQDPCFSHLLICSTAPLEAERAYRPGITETVIEASAPKLAALRNDLQRFFNEPGAGEGRKRLRLVVRIHGYNVPLPAVEQEYAEAERKFHGDAQTMTVAPPDDYVLFVHYAWPSESFGAGGPLRWFRAMPVALLLLLILGGVLAITSSGVAALIGELLLGIAFTLTLLRIVVYFRDRERASSFGVFDAVEMIRALHHLVQDVIAGSEYKTRLDEGKAQRISLSFLGHSMGTMLTTSLIRVLSDVFDPQADAHIWQDNPLGPFGGKDCQPPATGREANEARPQRARVGDLFVLERLILVAADIPVWAITTGRSNNLASCLRRFRDTFLFVNDADVVLRLASTVANYFVFPSGTRRGGYRLGNLSISERTRPGRYGWREGSLRDLSLHGGLGSQSLCDKKTFRCPPWIGYPLNVVDCTDYTDQGRHLSAFTAGNPLLRPLNYAATLVMMLLGSFGLSKVDGHGGYFGGKFCLDLLYGLALQEQQADAEPSEEIKAGLRAHHISWISIPAEGPDRS